MLTFIVLVYLALTGFFIITVPIGVYIWYRVALKKEIERRRRLGLK